MTARIVLTWATIGAALGLVLTPENTGSELLVFECAAFGALIGAALAARLNLRRSRRL